MSNLLRYNPGVDAFMPACVTDCFPGTSGDSAANSLGGIYLDHSQAKVIDVDGGCNGSVAGELGGAGLAPNGWLARVDPSGAFLEGPVDLAGAAAWGKRDDPFRAHANGDVAWSWFDAPGSTTLHVARLKPGAGCGG